MLQNGISGSDFYYPFIKKETCAVSAKWLSGMLSLWLPTLKVATFVDKFRDALNSTTSSTTAVIAALVLEIV